MADDASVFAEYPSWLTPAEAAALIRQSIPDAQKVGLAIFERLRSGLVRAMASHSSVAVGIYNPKPIETIVMIPADHWRNISADGSANFWTLGEARIWIPRPRRDEQNRTIRYFGIKLDPKALRAMLPPPAVTDKPTATPPTKEQEQSQSRTTDKNITTEEFSKWLSPRAAVAFLSHLDYLTARQQIAARAQNALVRSYAETATIPTSLKSVDRPPAELVEIEPYIWKSAGNQFFNAGFWATGDISVTIHSGDEHRPGARRVTINFFGVRFDPEGLRKMRPAEADPRPIGSAVPPPAPVTPPPPDKPLPALAPEQPETPTGPPVSPAHLKAWADLYRQAYKGADDTTANREASAKGMFPGKSVSRQRIRDQFDRGKRGRKSREPS